MKPRSHRPGPTAPLVDLTPWLRLRWLLSLLPLAVVGLGLAGSALVPRPSVWTGTGLVLLAFLVAVGNVALTRSRPDDAPPESPLLLVILLGDVVLLSAVLAAAGGPSNPLTSLFLFPVILGSLLLRPRAAWVVLAASAVGYALLFAGHTDHAAHHSDAMAGHFQGMFVAYAITAALVVYAVLQSRHALHVAETRSLEAQVLRDRTARLTALATLAAGASHELASPLSTILVVARELEVRASSADDLEDAQLVRAEVLRCQDILHQLAADAGAGMGEVPREVLLADVLASAARDDPRVRCLPCSGTVVLPVTLVGQALRRLVGNAREASPPEAPIEVSVENSDGETVFVVVDHGCGMIAETLARAPEPFFTTRAEGTGTGLGLYFVDSVAQHLGGRLSLESTPGVGTTARLHLPHLSGGSP